MEIKVDGRLLVSTLCDRFKEEFGGTLRVYQGNKRLTGTEKVADIATATGAYECRGSKTVGGFEKDMLDKFGIKVQVASADDWVYCGTGYLFRPEYSYPVHSPLWIAAPQPDRKFRSFGKAAGAQDTAVGLGD